MCRARPYTVIENLQLLVKEQSDWSFPSGHAGSSFAVATVIFRNMSKKVGVPTLVLAFLIGFSRLYVGVHYMTDVLCGALLGVAIGIAVEVLCRKLKFISLH